MHNTNHTEKIVEQEQPPNHFLADPAFAEAVKKVMRDWQQTGKPVLSNQRMGTDGVSFTAGVR